MVEEEEIEFSQETTRKIQNLNSQISEFDISGLVDVFKKKSRLLEYLMEDYVELFSFMINKNKMVTDILDNQFKQTLRLSENQVLYLIR